MDRPMPVCPIPQIARAQVAVADIAKTVRLPPLPLIMRIPPVARRMPTIAWGRIARTDSAQHQATPPLFTLPLLLARKIFKTVAALAAIEPTVFVTMRQPVLLIMPTTPVVLRMLINVSTVNLGKIARTDFAPVPIHQADDPVHIRAQRPLATWNVRRVPVT